MQKPTISEELAQKISEYASQIVNEEYSYTEAQELKTFSDYQTCLDLMLSSVYFSDDEGDEMEITVNDLNYMICNKCREVGLKELLISYNKLGKRTLAYIDEHITSLKKTNGQKLCIKVFEFDDMYSKIVTLKNRTTKMKNLIP